jgi:hypothetical protein
MDAIVTWAIIALFYAPLHFAIPLLIVFFRATPSEEARRADLMRTAWDCAGSMTLAFTLVIWLARERLGFAMTILLASMAVPYVRLLLRRRPA